MLRQWKRSGWSSGEDAALSRLRARLPSSFDYDVTSRRDRQLIVIGYPLSGARGKVKRS